MIIVVPETWAQPSGGNIFNRLFVRALRKAGAEAEALTAGPALSRMKEAKAGSWWVDSLCFDKLDEFIALQREKRKVYALVHSLPSLEPGLKPSERRRRIAGERRLLRDVSGFLVTSDWTRSLLKKRGVGRRPILVVPPAPAVFPGRRRPVPRGFAGLMVNNIIRRKGVLEFLRCLGRRLERTDLFTLRIAGRLDIEPGYARRCLGWVDRSPRLREKVEFLGPLPPLRIKRCYEGASVFIAASEAETFGMAFQEAVLFGLPVLALDAPYSRRLLRRGGSGLLFDGMSGLADACVAFIRDPSALAAFAERSRDSTPSASYGWGEAARLFLDQFPGQSGF
jgi:glycosyltransferase involved in cell wall biosynthesis